VRADPWTARRYVAQHLVEHYSRSSFMDRIDPDKYAVRLQKLLADERRNIISVNRGLRVNAECHQLFKHTPVAIVVRRCRAPLLLVAAPEDSDRITSHDHAAAPARPVRSMARGE
jgi:hypothetical protein